MRRVLIFGNSGSGKSTLAKSHSRREGLAHFDLDTIAWLPVAPPERAPINDSASQIRDFVSAHQAWAIEGCYADLIEIAMQYSNEIIFLNLPVEICVENARNRSWEPHKYPTREQQDANLGMLIDWIKTYPSRDDPCSLKAHLALFQKYQGKKTMNTANEELG